ncbi:MAG: tetratricopeptide repeat protein [Candidatus Margulisiibacteriota bacterium]
MPEKLQKYLDLAIEITFYALILFAPLFFDRRIGIVFSLTKATWIRALTFIILGLIATKLLSSKGNKFIRTPLDIPVLTYIVVVAASTLISINVWISFIGSYGRYEGFITILNYVVLFFVTANYIDTIRKKRRIMMLALISSLVMGLYGIIQRIGADPYQWGGVVTNERVIATIGQPNFLAAYLAMAFLMGIYLLFTLNNNRPIYFSKKEPAKNMSSLSKKQIKLLKRNTPQKMAASYSVNWQEIIFQSKFFAAFISVPSIFVFALYYVDGNVYFLSWLAVFFIAVTFAIYYAFNFEHLDYRISSLAIIISLIINLGGLLSTQSRGGLVGLACGLVVFAIICGRQTLYEYRRKIIISAVFCTVIGIISFATIGADQVGRFVGEVDVSSKEGVPRVEAQGAAGSRIETWTSSFHVIADNVLFGIGPEVVKMRFPQYETPKFRFKEAFHVKQDRSHNETLDMAVTRGIVGLVVYVWLLFSVFRLGLNNMKEDPGRNVLTAGLLGAMAAYLIQNQFSFGVVAMTSLFWIIMGMVPKEQERCETKPAAAKVELIIAVWLVVAVFLYISSFPYLGDKYFKTAQNYAAGGQFDESFENFEKSLKYMTFDGGYYTHYGMTVLNSRAGKPPDAALMRKAIDVFARGQKVDPYNADNFYMSGRAHIILNDMGQGDYVGTAKGLSEKAIIIDPYYAEAYQNLSYIAEKRGDLKEAIRLYEKAFEAFPKNMDIGLSIYRYYKQAGQSEKAFEILERPLQIEPANGILLVLLGDLYREAGFYKKAVEKYNAALAIDHSDVKAIVGIGMVLLQTNKDKEAFNKFQEAMMIEPDNAVLNNGLGAYYMKTGDRQKAAQSFKQALASDGSNEYARRMLEYLK